MRTKTCIQWWVFLAVACEGPVAVPGQDEDTEVEDGTTGEVPDDEDPDDPPPDVPDVPSPAVCGNGIVDGEEECDGIDLGGATCQDYGAFAGTLSCTDACVIETCDCDWGEGPSCGPPVCGNGRVEGDEACDGNAFAEWDFTPTCEDILGEPYHGELDCDAQCEIDTSPCGQCGDAIVQQAYEECDGLPLDEDGNPLACEPGYEGVIACEACVIVDMCEPLCGNDVLDADEECDGPEFGAATCESFGYVGGDLTCGSDCTIYSYTCSTCGDGILDVGEVCDGLDFGGADCSDFAVDGEGEPVCTESCELEAVSCVAGGGAAVISELLVAAAADPLDNLGEWIELHNPNAESFDLLGCELRGQAGFETFAFEESLVIPADGYITLGQGTDLELGFVPDYVLPEQVTFINGGDIVRLVCAGIEVDAVDYDDAAPWPAFAAGVAIAVVDPGDAEANDEGEAWCSSASVYGLEQTGTPGFANDCP